MTSAEHQVVGSVLLSPDALDQVRDILTPEDLHDPRLETILAAAYALDQAGTRVDPLTVADHLGPATLHRIGGTEALHALTAAVITTGNVTYHAHIVAKGSARRRLAQLATWIQASIDDGADPTELQHEARNRLDTLTPPGSELRPLAETIPATLDQLQTGIVPHVPTGWPELDDLIHGWRPGALHVAGARPGGGKSILGLQSAMSVASRGKAVAMATMEMDAHELNLRILAQATTVGIDSLTRHHLSPMEWERLTSRLDRVLDRQVYVDDTGTQTVAHIRAHARKVARRHDLGLVVVDYLQLVAPAPHMRTAKRHEQVDDVARSLKLLARELGVPVLALSQINRGPEARADKRPTMADFRESGGIENHTDVAILLHRESPEDPTIHCQVGKARSARTGSFELSWQAHFARLGSMRPAS